MEDCLFCKIVKGEIPCFKVYEDEVVMAFMDIGPIIEGHVLVIPKTHFENLFNIEEDVLKKVFIVAKRIALRMKEVLGVNGVNLHQSNGKAAGQSVMHFHVHILPRKQEDKIDLNAYWKTVAPEMEKQDIAELAEKLKIEN